MTSAEAKMILILPIFMALTGDFVLKEAKAYALPIGILLFGLEAPLVWLVYRKLTFIELAIYWQVLTAFVTILLSVFWFKEGFSVRHILALGLAIASALLLE